MQSVKCDSCGKLIIISKFNHEHCKQHFCSLSCHYDYPLLSLRKRYGTVVRGKDIGRPDGYFFIKHKCLDCGLERWVQSKGGQPASLRCRKCSRAVSRVVYAGVHARNRYINSNGYTMVRLTADDPYFGMVERVGLSEGISGYVLEHRLIIARQLGRALNRKEVVHHLNGERSDNRPDNLLLLTGGKHNRLIPAMQKRIQKLEGLLHQQGQLI